MRESQFWFLLGNMHIVASYLATDKIARIAFIILATCGIILAVISTFREEQERKIDKELYNKLILDTKTLKKKEHFTSK